MIDVEQVSVFRGDSDRKGNVSKQPVGVVSVLFGWGSWSRGRLQGDSVAGSPQVYVTKGTDLRARDRIERANGERYSVLGHALWDQPAELEVFGFAWVAFDVEVMNG